MMSILLTVTMLQIHHTNLPKLRIITETETNTYVTYILYT